MRSKRDAIQLPSVSRNSVADQVLIERVAGGTRLYGEWSSAEEAAARPVVYVNTRTREIVVSLSHPGVFGADFTIALGDAFRSISVPRALAAYYTPVVRAVARRARPCGVAPSLATQPVTCGDEEASCPPRCRAFSSSKTIHSCGARSR